jgi:peptidyl-prolyl cis-trans isomerase SurA
LAQSYLGAKKDEKLLQDAYERSKESSEVSAVLITFGAGGPAGRLIPADTLPAYQKAMEVWKKADEGTDFEALVREYSDDEPSKQNERPGYVGWFSPMNLVPVLEFPLSNTPAGAISLPVRTAVGYYVLKIHEKRANPETSYDDLRAQLENKIVQTGGLVQLYQPIIEQWKEAHQYTVNEKAYRLLYEASNRMHPLDSLYVAAFSDNQETLFSVGQPISIADFIDYLKSNPRSHANLSTEYLSGKFDDFVYEKLKEAEDSQLENKYPEFKNLMQEYHDGILLFEVSNREVWDKASNDTLGLAQYFEVNKSKYAWDEPHWKGYVVLLKDAKAQKGIQKEIKKMSPDQAARYLVDKYNTADSTQIQVEKGLFVKGQNPYVDEAIFGGDKAAFTPPYSAFILVGKVLSQNLPEEYADVKGLVITDYQDHLELEWVKQLNEKYPVEIYKDVIAKEIK